MVDAALTVLEIVAILLTLLFITVQYLSRQISSEILSDNLLSEAARSVSTTALLLLLSAYLAWIFLVTETEDMLVTSMVIVLLGAFAVIAVAIRETAKELAGEFDEQSAGKHNTAEDQASLNEFEE